MGSNFTDHSKIYSIPACPPAHPRYCFINTRSLERPQGVGWEVLEVEIDLSIPGPIKVFSRVSRQYSRQVPTGLLHDNDNDLLLYLPLGDRLQPSASLSVQFLRVGMPTKVRVARLGMVDKMHLSRLSVDRDAGYLIVWTADDCCPYCGGGGVIWWLDDRKAGNMVRSRTK